MKIIFNCHTEYDLENQFGRVKGINSSEQSFKHLPILLNWLNFLKIPMTFSIAVGGPFQKCLLNYIQGRKIIFPLYSDLGIHYHSEKFKNSQWQFTGFLKKSEYSGYFQLFEKVFGSKPKTMVFGKWQIDKSVMNFLWQLGIEKDGSFVDTQKVIAQPFFIDNVLEIPVISFDGQPVNPLTRLSHFFLLRKIIKKYHPENLILQISFHSYDFFKFNQKPKLRLIKKIIFKNLLKIIRRYNLEITTLSKIEETHFEGLEKVKMPFLNRLLNLLGH